MSIPLTSEYIQAHPAQVITRIFEGSISGFDSIREANFFGKKFPVALAGDERELFLGQHAKIRGNSAGYVPGNLKPEDQVQIVGFNYPHTAGISDEVIRVISKEQNDYGFPVSIKPTNIESLYLPEKVSRDIEQGTVSVMDTKIDFLYAKGINPDRNHVMAIHYSKEGADIQFVLGDNVHVHEKGTPDFQGQITAISVDGSVAEFPEVWISVLQIDGNKSAEHLVKYNEVTL